MEKQHLQIVGLVLAFAAIVIGALVLLSKPASELRETALVMSQTAIALPGEAHYENRRFTVQLQGIPGNIEQVQVRVSGPAGLIDEWRQGLGSKSYDSEPGRYFVDILSIMDDKTQITDVTVSVRREL